VYKYLGQPVLFRNSQIEAQSYSLWNLCLADSYLALLSALVILYIRDAEIAESESSTFANWLRLGEKATLQLIL